MTVEFFPLHREVGRVRRVALRLTKIERRLASRYFDQECSRQEVRLHMHGMPQEVIEDELDLFANAVRAEIDRLIHGAQRDGAA